MRREESAVSGVVMSRDNGVNPLGMVEYPLVGALRVPLSEDAVVNEETRGVTDDEGILVVGDPSGSL